MAKVHHKDKQYGNTIAVTYRRKAQFLLTSSNSQSLLGSARTSNWTIVRRISCQERHSGLWSSILQVASLNINIPPSSDTWRKGKVNVQRSCAREHEGTDQGTARCIFDGPRRLFRNTKCEGLQLLISDFR